MTLPDHVRENKASWEIEATNYVEPARRHWATDEISWGSSACASRHRH